MLQKLIIMRRQQPYHRKDNNDGMIVVRTTVRTCRTVGRVGRRVSVVAYQISVINFHCFIYIYLELVPFSVRSKVEHPKVNSRYISVRLQ